MGTILTHTGRTVDLADPESADVVVEDVAHSLSLLCRYGGHARSFYSVAEHSVRVEHFGRSVLGERRPGARLAYLLHDASEAYLGDVVSPLKELLPDYRALEERWESSLRRKFGCAWDDGLEARVKDADHAVFLLERQNLFGSASSLLGCGRSPRDAEEWFLEVYHRLLAEGGAG